jgi:hypothetical protein
MRYNPEGHDVHVMAKKLLIMLENKWEKESAAIQKKFSGDSGGAPVPSAGKRLAEEPADERTPLTFDEKRDLCASMNKLPGKQVFLSATVAVVILMAAAAAETAAAACCSMI